MAVTLRYFTELVNLRCRKRSVAEFMLAFLVRVQCRRKESSRLLSHLLMSFLLHMVSRDQGCLSDARIIRNWTLTMQENKNWFGGAACSKTSQTLTLTGTIYRLLISQLCGKFSWKVARQMMHVSIQKANVGVVVRVLKLCTSVEMSSSYWRSLSSSLSSSSFVVIFVKWLTKYFRSVASPAMGLWGTCPIDFHSFYFIIGLFLFHFGVNLTANSPTIV